ncbi:hypothetical protein [Methanospirillum lacunae]|uniref:hypothetical protein n=1 Tax=Methanospirillum lacunae TaxID=668570 RepID=UPI00268D9B9B
MRHGLIRLPSWHNPLLFKWRGRWALIAVACLLLAGPLCADLIATTISTDGSVMLKTSASDENGSFTSRILSRDESQVTRTAGDDNGLYEDLAVRGSGQTLFSEYADALLSTRGIKTICAFLDTPDTHEGNAAAYSSGIVQGGGYASSRTISQGLSGRTAANGTGLIFLGSESQGNRSFKTGGFISGNLSVEDMMTYGVKI